MKEVNNIKKWDEAIHQCEMHFNRMSFASQSLERFFPLNEKAYLDWSEENIALADQMIYRFSKLQDAIGGKLFRLILLLNAEDIEGMSFKDILFKIEKLEIIESANLWLQLRETRNIVTHEYPESTSEIVEGLNLLKKDVGNISKIYMKLKNLKF